MLKKTYFRLYVCIGSKKIGAFETYGESLSHVKKYGGISKKYQNLTFEEALEISKNEEKIINKRQEMYVNNNNFRSKSECEKYTKKILEKYKKNNSKNK